MIVRIEARSVFKGLGSGIAIRKLREVAFTKEWEMQITRLRWWPFSSTYGIKLIGDIPLKTAGENVDEAKAKLKDDMTEVFHNATII